MVGGPHSYRKESADGDPHSYKKEAMENRLRRWDLQGERGRVKEKVERIKCKL